MITVLPVESVKCGGALAPPSEPPCALSFCYIIA